MINPYLYGDGEGITPNPDISGIGVRQTIYIQSLLTQFVAMGHRTSREAIAINAANAVAVGAFTVASAYIVHPDWPHLLIIYHFLLLISFSGITYNTVRPSFRKKEKEFGRLIERLCIIDMFAFPFCIIVTAVLWIGIMIARHQKRFYPVVNCNFGRYVIFGQIGPWVVVDRMASLHDDNKHHCTLRCSAKDQAIGDTVLRLRPSL